MKVLHLISSGGFYGAESVLSNLAQGLQKAGVGVVVGVFHNARNPNLDILERLGKHSIPVEVIPCAGRFDWRAAGVIRRVIREHAIDVVHSHGYKADLYAIAAARPLQVPFIATCHNWPGRSLPLRAYAALDRWILRYFSRIVAVSKEVAGRLERAGVRREKIVNISNGIDLERYRHNVPARDIRTEAKGEAVVGFVGRLVPEKGCDVLLEAAAGLVATFPTARFVFVGEGQGRASMEASARKLGLQQNVCFVGRREDMPNVYAALDIFVLPSFAEGMPMTVLEALASGKAVIATRVGALPGMIEHGETGLLIEPRNVEELREALHGLLSNPERREKLGRRGAACVRQLHSLERMTMAYVEVYREVAGSRMQGHGTGTQAKKSFPTSVANMTKVLDPPTAGNAEHLFQFSVIIPCLNEQAVIGRCLEALNQLDFDLGAFEVIVADNGSKDGTIEMARASSGRLNLVTLIQTDVRTSGLRNAAAASARGRFLAFLDADCLVPKDWLQFAAGQLSKPDAGIIGGHCGIPENSPWVPRVWYSDRQRHKQGAVSYVPGANLLVSRANFSRIGGFDESLETNEDCELCERGRRKGLTVIAYPELGVVHLRDPQTIWAFYRKQSWHGKHVFKVFVRNLPSAVNARPVLFALFTLVMLACAIGSLVMGKVPRFGICMALLLLPSLLLSFRVALRRHRWKDFAPLVVLHLLYGLGRASALLNPRNWWGASKTSERVKSGKTVLPPREAQQS